MARCEKCGKPIDIPYVCPYCGGKFCYDHSSREKHNCVITAQTASTLGLRLETQKPLPAVKGKAARNELNEVLKFEKEFDSYLNDLLESRVDQTTEFGKQFSVKELALYLLELFGSVLFFDIPLSIVQQYSIADVEVVSKPGKSAMRTGFNLALFGQPRTGKTFAALDMILGKPGKSVSAHGLPGRNRYCGGMTPARFIEIGQAYQGRKFLQIQITKENITASFDHVISERNIPFDEFIEKYL